MTFLNRRISTNLFLIFTSIIIFCVTSSSCLGTKISMILNIDQVTSTNILKKSFRRPYSSEPRNNKTCWQCFSNYGAHTENLKWKTLEISWEALSKTSFVLQNFPLLEGSFVDILNFKISKAEHCLAWNAKVSTKLKS